MQIETIRLSKLHKYENNPRRNEQAIEFVANSIKEFGFKNPIIVDRNNVIVCGHTRYDAAKRLGIKEVPCIRADDLTDEQIKAFRLADNKVSEVSEWDFDALDIELDGIDIDMEQFGFEIDYVDEEAEHEQNKEQTQNRVRNILNLNYANYKGVGKYDIPQIAPVYELPEIKEWIGFNYVLSDNNPSGKAVHFFVDDYQFERVWNEPNRYLEKLSQYACVLAPDFSPYMDMPLATQIYNHYRKHWLAKYWQESGITVIPTIRASADPRSLEWYLEGEPTRSIVCISSMWTANETDENYFVNEEFRRMKDALEPSKIFVYGRKVQGISGNIEYIDTFTRKRFD